MRTFFAGLDAGNKLTNLVLQAGRRARERDRVKVMFPSAIGDGSLAELLRLRKVRTPSQLAAGEYVVQLEADGREVFVGRLALAQAANADTGRGNEARYWTDTRTLVCTGVAAAVPDPAVEVYVVTNMPNRLWSFERDELVRRHLVGDWRFMCNGVPRRVVVRGALATMEGAGALVRLGDVPPAYRGVVDIGGGDSDLLVMDPDLQPYMPMCDSKPLGIDSIGDRLTRSFQAEHGRALLPDELDRLLDAYGHSRPLPPIYQDQEPIDLAPAFVHAVNSVGKDIRTMIKRAWDAGGQVAGNLASVSFIGGGVYFFEPFIRAEVQKLLIPTEPVYENAQGNCDMAVALTPQEWADLG